MPCHGTLGLVSLPEHPPEPYGLVTLTGITLDAAYSAAERAKRGPGQPDQEAATAVILAQATLESFINEEIEAAPWKRGPHFDPWKGNPPTPRTEAQWEPIRWMLIEKTPFRERWQHFMQINHGYTIPPGAEPFQSFTLLVKLRNLLAHHTPRMGSMTAMPVKGLESGLGTRYPLTPIRANEDTWAQRLLNAGCARWACETAVAMLREYCKAARWPDPFDPTTDPEHFPRFDLPPWQQRQSSKR